MSEYLDTSVVVKWFREGEGHREESLKLRERIINFDTEFVMSFYGVMELVRALVKNKYPKDKIEDSFQSMMDLYKIDAIKSVGIEETLYRAKDIAIEQNLYAGDALHLASAIQYGCKIFWSEDKHHLKASTREFMERYNIEIRSLSQIKI
ncbi:MAG: type II toxin-antitoxin system VapC family toxin [Methanomassiliicoccales archaeon]|nr:MAG: type II toxin-antitoxin system VapC family toxin [Methanomassiliicoccales archaeon]